MLDAYDAETMNLAPLMEAAPYPNINSFAGKECT